MRHHLRAAGLSSSAFLRGEKTGVTALSRYLATRGAMLILLEATWISFSWQFGYQVAIFQVIWAIGASMLIMALLVWLPRVAIGAIGAALILTHNAFDSYTSTSLLWGAWHQGGFFPMGQSIGIEGLVIKYPLMPWVGLMAARLSARSRVPVGGAAPHPLLADVGGGHAGRLYRPARVQHLRRRRPLGGPASGTDVRPDVVRARVQVPAFAAVPAGHARDRHAAAGPVRTDPRKPRADAVRPHPDVLLRDPHRADPLPRQSVLRAALRRRPGICQRRGALAGRLCALAAGGVRGLGRDPGPDVRPDDRVDAWRAQA
ncbi:hypothetical protein LP420_17320 [Massilia sp. B-10]|nr:hypothetical protein LP420_17320 [Massilia sp. B-10]